MWVSARGGRDHNPIFLEVSKEKYNIPSPYNFNPIWLEEEEFTNLVKRE